MSHENHCKFAELCEIYLLYFDEVIGHVFLLTCPENIISLDPTKKNIILHHPIWFLDLKDDTAINRIDLEYNEIMYFAKKFLVNSGRIKKRAGSIEDQHETIILIITLSADLDIFGGELLNLLTYNLTNEFRNNFVELIESEIAKLEIIKTTIILQKIERGEQIKEKIKYIINSVCEKYFSSIIKQTDAISIKLQKAISYLIFRGIDIDHIVRQSHNKEFSNIRLFDYDKVKKRDIETKEKFKLISITPINDYQEFEILIKNVYYKPLNNLRANVTYIQDFFEKEILNERIEKSFPDEEVLFVVPIPEKINEFLFSIMNDVTKKKLYSRKLKIDMEF
jgi:hypothetical protein